MATLAETLRAHIDRREGSLRSVAVGSGVDYAILYRFVHKERQIQLNVVQRLCDYLDLELVPRDRAARKKRR